MVSRNTILAVLIAVIAVSLIAVRWATRPLKTLADAADELGKNINRPPLAETGPTEVARAARASCSAFPCSCSSLPQASLVRKGYSVSATMMTLLPLQLM